MAKRKRTNNDLQNITHKTKDRVTRTTLNTGDELMCPGRVGSSCSASGARRVTLVTSPILFFQSCHKDAMPRIVFVLRKKVDSNR